MRDQLTLADACKLAGIETPVSRDELKDVFVELYRKGIDHNVIHSKIWFDLMPDDISCNS